MLLFQKSCSLRSESDVSSSDDQIDYSGLVIDDCSSDDGSRAKPVRKVARARRKPLSTRKVQLADCITLYAELACAF